MAHRSLVRREHRKGRTHLVIDFSYTDGSGRKQRYRRDATATSMAAARVEAERLVNRAATTGSPHPSERGTTFGVFVTEVYRPLFMSRLKPGTQTRYAALLEHQGVLRAFGGRPLEAIDGALVRRYAADLEVDRHIKPKGHVDLVRSVLRAAVEHGALDEMPRLPSFRPSDKLPEAPSADDIAALLGVATGWLHTAIALAACAGLRSGEVRGLKVGDVDFAANVIRVRRAYSEDVLVDTTKTGRERVVPMATEIVPILKAATRDKLPGAFVVLDRGRTPRRQQVLHRLKSLQRKHGLREHSYHAVRHYFCSRLLVLGANIEAVRMLAGHTKLATTQRYVHATGSDLVAAVARFGDGIGNQVETPSLPKR